MIESLRKKAQTGADYVGCFLLMAIVFFILCLFAGVLEFLYNEINPPHTFSSVKIINGNNVDITSEFTSPEEIIRIEPKDYTEPDLKDILNAQGYDVTKVVKQPDNNAIILYVVCDNNGWCY